MLADDLVDVLLALNLHIFVFTCRRLLVEEVSNGDPFLSTIEDVIYP